MKRILFFLFFGFNTLFLFGNNGFNWQGVLRNSSGAPFPNKNVKVHFLVKSCSTQATLLHEEHITQSNQFGLLSLVIGKGSVLSGKFDNLKGGGKLCLNVSVFDAGNGQKLIDTDTELQSVPNALTADNGIKDVTVGPNGVSINTPGGQQFTIPGTSPTADQQVGTDSFCTTSTSPPPFIFEFKLMLFLDYKAGDCVRVRALRKEKQNPTNIAHVELDGEVISYNPFTGMIRVRPITGTPGDHCYYNFSVSKINCDETALKYFNGAFYDNDKNQLNFSNVKGGVVSTVNLPSPEGDQQADSDSFCITSPTNIIQFKLKPNLDYKAGECVEVYALRKYKAFTQPNSIQIASVSFKAVITNYNTSSGLTTLSVNALPFPVNGEYCHFNISVKKYPCDERLNKVYVNSNGDLMNVYADGEISGGNVSTPACSTCTVGSVPVFKNNGGLQNSTFLKENTSGNMSMGGNPDLNSMLSISPNFSTSWRGILIAVNNLLEGLKIQQFNPNGKAMDLTGKVDITGNLSVNGNINATGTKNFRIDHPFDQSKYLVHAAIESNEALNQYSGNIVTDGNGEAEVSLPYYFEAINKNFRYQLTCIGSFAQAIIIKEISNNRFTIKTDKPNVKVSWQVTSERNDRQMQEQPFKDEILK